MADAETKTDTTEAPKAKAKAKEPETLRIRNCMKPHNAKIFTSVGVLPQGQELDVPEAEAYNYIDKGIAVDAKQAAATDARKAARATESGGDSGSRAE